MFASQFSLVIHPLCMFPVDRGRLDRRDQGVPQIENFSSVLPSCLHAHFASTRVKSNSMRHQVVISRSEIWIISSAKPLEKVSSSTSPLASVA